MNIDRFSSAYFEVGPRWDGLIDAALDSLGAKGIAAYSSSTNALFGDGGGTAEIWIATDVGLAVMSLRDEGGIAKVVVDWTAWKFVQDPEVRTEVIGLENGDHVTTRLTIQRPRFDAESGNDHHGLSKFAAAVLRLAEGR